jgi:peptidoglycan L-alanyl-D-glutamate endopeptidase CwlK
MDKISQQRISLLHPKLRKEAEAILTEIETVLKGRAICRFTHTLRTWAEQTALYNQGRTTPGQKVTNAKAGSSFHNYGLAIDIALVVDTDGNGTFDKGSWDTKGDYDGDKKSDWMECVAIFQKYGWEWGGNWTTFKDLPHFQKTFGKSITQLKVLYQEKKFIPGTTYVNI